MPPSGGWLNFSDISVEWFQSSNDISQMALQSNGSAVVRGGRDPLWQHDIMGNTTIMRQYSYSLFILQHSDSSGVRADTGEFLEDFTAWLDAMNVTGQLPAFGDEPYDERLWATGGSKVAEWDGSPTASVYMVQLHHIYTKKYESED